MPTTKPSLFLDWLISDAGAGWTFGILTVLSWIVTAIVRRARPLKIKAVEITRFSTMEIDPELRDRTEVRFDNVTVSNLQVSHIVLRNSGSSVINSPEIVIELPVAAKLLTVRARAMPGGKDVPLTLNNHTISIHPMFLNPYKEHRSEVQVTLLCDGELTDVAVTGSGVGWSLVFDAIPSLGAKKRRVKLAFFGVAFAWLISLILFAIVKFVFKGTGLEKSYFETAFMFATAAIGAIGTVIIVSWAQGDWPSRMFTSYNLRGVFSGSVGKPER